MSLNIREDDLRMAGEKIGFEWGVATGNTQRPTRRYRRGFISSKAGNGKADAERKLFCRFYTADGRSFGIGNPKTVIVFAFQKARHPTF